MTDAALPPENLPVAPEGNDPFDVIEAEVNSAMSRIDALVPPEPLPPPEKKEARVVPLVVEVPKVAPMPQTPKPLEAAPVINPLKTDYERRIQATVATPKVEATPTPPVKQTAVPFPIRPAVERAERPVPVAVIAETKPAPDKKETLKVLVKEAEIAAKRAEIAKRKADLAREEIELDQLEAA